MKKSEKKSLKIGHLGPFLHVNSAKTAGNIFHSEPFKLGREPWRVKLPFNYHRRTMAK